MSTTDDPPPPPHANATIQLDALDANEVQLESSDSAGASGHVKPPPLPVEALSPPSAPVAPPLSAPVAPPLAAPVPRRSSKAVLYAVGFLLLLGAAIYGGLHVGRVARTAPAPSAIVSVAPAPPAASPPATTPPATTASEAPATITIPTIEVR